jgi:HAMP domain-containing protein
MQFHSHILVELENPLDPKRNARRKLERMMVKNTPNKKIITQTFLSISWQQDIP